MTRVHLACTTVGPVGGSVWIGLERAQILIVDQCAKLSQRAAQAADRQQEEEDPEALPHAAETFRSGARAATHVIARWMEE